MNNPANFVASLKNYNKDAIKESTLKKLKKFTNDSRFEPDNIARYSLAAKSVCMWVCAMNTYAEVLKIVNPLKTKLALTETERTKADNSLKEKNKEL